MNQRCTIQCLLRLVRYECSLSLTRKKSVAVNMTCSWHRIVLDAYPYAGLLVILLLL